MAETLVATDIVDDIVFPDMILATKLYIPPLRPNLVSRLHLLARLDTALERTPGVILLSAPAGFGKTTLLSEWLAQIENRKVAWLSLDEDDNDPNRFLAYCVAALQGIQPGVGQAALAIVHKKPNALPTTPETLVTILINEMVAVGDPFILVFDDYHVVEHPLLHECTTFLLDNLPPQAQVVIISRSDPPLPLTRLRGQGQLTELGTADLRFNPGEVATFLSSTMGLNLSTAEVSILEGRTEGWIAGLQMAALSMQGVKDTAGFVKTFSGTHRHIMDYLLEEVLNRQPEHIQQFLLQTSILNRLTGPLCDAVTQSRIETGQDMLEQMEQANLFIIPLDDERRWYRYHHLFVDLLRHRLEESPVSFIPSGGSDPPPVSPPTGGDRGGAIAELHRRASQWYEENGLITEAMNHALTAFDIDHIVRLAKQKAATLLSRSELVTLLSWLDNLPQTMTRSGPRASLVQAWAMLLTGQLQAVEGYLQEAEHGFEIIHTGVSNDVSTDILGETLTLRAAVAYFQRDMQQAIESYNQALEYLSSDNLFMRGIVKQCLGAAYSWRGNVVEAAYAFAEAGAISQKSGNIQVALIALWNLAQLQIEQGYLHQADETYRQALQLINNQGEPEDEALLPYAGRVYIGLAELMYQRNELEAATRHVQDGLRLGEQAQESGTLAGGYLVLARIEQAQGELTKALEAIQHARHFAQRYNGPRFLTAQVTTYQAHLWIGQALSQGSVRGGNLRAVTNWVNEQELQLDPLPDQIPYLRESEYLVLARFLLAQAQQKMGETSPLVASPLEVAEKLLNHIIEAATESKRMGRVVEALSLKALVYQAQGETGQALNMLQEVLSLTEPEGYVRLFADEGPAMADLLHQATAQNLTPNYTTKLLAAFNQSSQPPSLLAPQPSPLLLDPLSDRELEILQLIATGLSNRELAEQLVVTVGTVKWHLNNIYSKLNVRSRTQAVAKARELGLLQY